MRHSRLRRFFILVCLPAAAVCGSFATTVLRAADPVIVNVWPEWRSADSFDRIGEYFGHGENTGGHRILRTRAQARAGFYFVVRLAPTIATADARFEVRVIEADAPEPKTFTFSASAPAGENTFELGLTGQDWPGGKSVHPVAWKLTLLAADGRVLAEQKSFLWEKPAK